MARRALGLPADGIVVVATAALRPEKRLDILLDALAELRSAGVEITAVLMGDGPERDALEARAQRLRLGWGARFLGNRTDVQDVLAAADIGVLCSDREGTPLAVLEYMQAGLRDRRDQRRRRSRGGPPRAGGPPGRTRVARVSSRTHSAG